MTTLGNRVDLLIKLKEAIDIIRDVRPDDAANKERIRVATALLETIITELQRPPG
jgi:hypothetical protein